GEKTAAKLIAQYGSVENLLAHTTGLKGKLRENLEKYRDQALLSKRLATINRHAPVEANLERLKLRPPNENQLKQLLSEFEFNSIGRRLFGDDFKAGRGFAAPGGAQAPPNESATQPEQAVADEPAPAAVVEEKSPVRAELKT